MDVLRDALHRRAPRGPDGGGAGGAGIAGGTPELAAYLRDFAAGRFFEAHEDLEPLWWSRDGDPFLQGLILFAAAFVKLQRGMPAGALRHFAAAARYLAPFLPAREGIDVADAVGFAERAQALLNGGAPTVPAYRFRSVQGEEAGPPLAPDPLPLATAVGAALQARRAAGEPVGQASWAPLVKEVIRATAGRWSREAVRDAVRRALAAADRSGERNTPPAPPPRKGRPPA